MLEQVGALLPTAAGIALSPFPIVAVTLVVSAPRGRLTGPTFALGWVVGLSVLTVVAVGIGGLVGDEDAEPGRWASWVRVGLGAALLALGARKLLAGSKGDEPTAAPGWMAGLATASPGRAAGYGAALAALNPKNIAFALASASIIGQAGQELGSTVVQAALFVLLASASVLGVVGMSLLGGRRGARALEVLRRTMLTHADVITAVVLVLIGVAVLSQGLEGLG